MMPMHVRTIIAYIAVGNEMQQQQTAELSSVLEASSSAVGSSFQQHVFFSRQPKRPIIGRQRMRMPKRIVWKLLNAYVLSVICLMIDFGAAGGVSLILILNNGSFKLVILFGAIKIKLKLVEA